MRASDERCKRRRREEKKTMREEQGTAGNCFFFSYTVSTTSPLVFELRRGFQ